MDLLLIRHGLPERIEGADGPADPPLSVVGRDQAEAMAVWLAGEEIDAVHTSPLRRARQTAEPLAARLDLALIVDDEVAEFDRNADSYVPIEELQATNDPRWQAMINGEYFADGDETPAAFQQRIVTAMDRIVAGHRSRTVAVVCHGGVINAFVGHVLGLEQFMVFQPDYTGITRIRASSQGHRMIVTLNETSHLRRR